jgi:hypothetical protein
MPSASLDDLFSSQTVAFNPNIKPHEFAPWVKRREQERRAEVCSSGQHAQPPPAQRPAPIVFAPRVSVCQGPAAVLVSSVQSQKPQPQQRPAALLAHKAQFCPKEDKNATTQFVLRDRVALEDLDEGEDEVEMGHRKLRVIEP